MYCRSHVAAISLAVPAMALLLLALSGAGLSGEAMADYFGRGSGGAEAGGPSGGLLAGLIMWLSNLQSALNAMLMGYLRDVRTDGLSAAGPVILAGFVYGVVHAAGPGHGKVVVAGYFLGTPARMATGIAFSFLMALVQALVAIVLVVVFALIVGTSLGQVAGQVAVLEPLSYALVAGIGAVMLWRAVRGRPTCAHCAAAGESNHHHLTNDHRYHQSHQKQSHHQPGGHHQGDADHDTIAGDRRSRAATRWNPINRLLALLPYDLRILAIGVGLRPCTGALLLLLFTLAGGIFTVGVLAVIAMGIGVGLTVSVAALLAGAARSGLMRGLSATGAQMATARVGRLVEIAGATLILAIGAMMLFGTMATGGLLR